MVVITNISVEGMTFEEIIKDIKFEDVASTRKAAILVDPESDGIPIVRTTTKYNNPMQLFTPAIKKLAQNIRANNAMVEIYYGKTKMKFHTDQALDLSPGSEINIFSCYKFPETAEPYKLKFKKKNTDEGGEIMLEHNLMARLSLDFNRNFVHKISGSSIWLGITFRTSGTFMRFIDETPYFSRGGQLRRATEEEEVQFFKLKSRENADPDFVYPELDYSISLGDFLQPVSCNRLH